MPRYYPAPTVSAQDIGAVERYLREEFERVRTSTDDIYLLSEILGKFFAIAAYGQIGLSAPTVLPDLGASWDTVPLDEALTANPKGITYDLANNGMQFDDVGVWDLGILVNLTFAESNAGRTVELRLFNITQGVATESFSYYVGRNQAGVNITFMTQADASEVANGDTLVVQVSGGTDIFTTVVAVNASWKAHVVSEYDGDPLSEARKILGV